MIRDFIQREIKKATQVLLAVLGMMKHGKSDEALQFLRDELNSLQADSYETENDLAKLWKIRGDLSNDSAEQTFAYQNALEIYQNLIAKAPFYDMSWQSQIAEIQQKLNLNQI